MAPNVKTLGLVRAMCDTVDFFMHSNAFYDRTRQRESFVEYLEQLRLAQNELESAMFFADLSLIAYSTGKLQHATDARSKAEILCVKATQRLTASAINRPDFVESTLGEVQKALGQGFPWLSWDSQYVQRVAKLGNRNQSSAGNAARIPNTPGLFSIR